jgi:hypothetical protein
MRATKPKKTAAAPSERLQSHAEYLILCDFGLYEIYDELAKIEGEQNIPLFDIYIFRALKNVNANFADLQRKPRQTIKTPPPKKA